MSSVLLLAEKHQCPYIKRGGLQCTNTTFNKMCGEHITRKQKTPCLQCETLTYAKSGYCGCTYKQIYANKKLRLKAQTRDMSAAQPTAPAQFVEPVQAQCADYSAYLTDVKIMLRSDASDKQVTCSELAQQIMLALENSTDIKICDSAMETWMLLQDLDNYGKKLDIKIADLNIAHEKKYVLILVNNNVHLVANIGGEIKFLYEGMRPAKNLPFRLLNVD